MLSLKRFVLFILFLVIFLNSVHANGEAQINWLKNQQSSVTGLVDSYEGDGENYAYTYDQALAIIAFTEANEIQRAKNILNRMQVLQRTNGAWYQCYNAANGNLGHGGCNYYPTGDISWMVMAINFYQVKTGDNSYSQMDLKALSWLDTVRNTNPAEEKYGSLNLCSGTACQYPTAISTENNYDAYSAYYYRGILEGDSSLVEKAELIKYYLVKEMWSGSPDSNCAEPNPDVFWVGYNDCGYFTDPQSWGVLALGANGPNGEDFTRALEWLHSYGYGYGSTRHTKTYNPTVDGFDFNTKPTLNSIWLEGTEGVAAAYYSIGDSEKGDYFHSQTNKVIAGNGGVIYSFSETDPSNIRWNENFRHNSIASTAWYYFNERRINPFRLEVMFNISLLKGWNLISVPLILLNDSVDDVFKDISYSKLFYYDSGWKVPNKIDNTFGYWIRVDNDGVLKVGGLPYGSGSINVNSGWNLAGYQGLDERDISALFNNVIVYIYNNSNWYSYVTDKPSNSLSKFIPGYGYWIKKI